ncbi:MAG TPA: DUF2934 domain-containing protein [Steroidobacteraceae bacterium]|nr:DUF2934 domain-containing protein [Steroidobacteraceae bacterium]
MAKRVVKVTKRETTRRAKVTELSDGAVMAVLDSEAKTIDPEARRRLVAAEAYFFAERRGFAGGNELEDWVAAEVVVDSRLKQQVA